MCFIWAFPVEMRITYRTHAFLVGCVALMCV